VRQVIIYPGEDGYWVAECPSLPGCISQGRTKEEAIQNIREAIDGYIAALEEDGLLVPEERFAVERKIFRVLDREGNILALRPDITTQVARIVGTKLHDPSGLSPSGRSLPLPLRFYYLTNVFRFEEPQAGRQREFYQAGLELIGASTPEADGEVIAIVIEALQRVGLQGFQINPWAKWPSYEPS
jgi:ATP phosphoribosyltransferase regulatory subunit HisZ